MQLLLLSKLIRRTIVQTLMGPGRVVKVHPALGCSQKVSHRAIGVALGDGQLKESHKALGDGQLKESHKALGIAVISRRSCPAHGADKALLQQERSGLHGSILLALIRMKDRSRHLKGHHLDRLDHQLGLHTVIKRQG